MPWKRLDSFVTSRPVAWTSFFATFYGLPALLSDDYAAWLELLAWINKTMSLADFYMQTAPGAFFVGAVMLCIILCFKSVHWIRAGMARITKRRVATLDRIAATTPAKPESRAAYLNRIAAEFLVGGPPTPTVSALSASLDVPASWDGWMDRRAVTLQDAAFLLHCRVPMDGKMPPSIASELEELRSAGEHDGDLRLLPEDNEDRYAGVFALGGLGRPGPYRATTIDNLIAYAATHGERYAPFLRAVSQRGKDGGK